MKRLLTEEEYAIKEKRKNRVSEAIAAIYWLITIAIYLSWSFWTNRLKITWIVWPIAAILFVVEKIACNLLLDISEE